MTTLEELADRARSGDGQGAFNASIARLESVKSASSATSSAYAHALFEHGSLCLLLGLTGHAVAAMREASEVRPSDKTGEQQRLTYLMNLGDALAHDGQLDAALEAHNRGLREREVFYGREHPGYGYGLDSMASVAIALGHYDRALSAARESLAIYNTHGHQRIVTAWALVFLAAAGTGASWQSLQMSHQVANAVVTELVNHLLPVAPTVLANALREIERFADEPRVLIHAWAGVQNPARHARDYGTWAAAVERIGELAAQMNDRPLVLDAQLGLALCRSDAGDHEGATTAYERAIALARDLGDADALAKTLRNAGIHRAERDREAGAQLLREAVALKGVSREEAGRTNVALGIQLQHAGDREGARTLLTSSLAMLPPVHPDAVCAASHLKALDEPGGCGCGKPTDEARAQVERMVRERLPAGLLQAIDWKDGNIAIRVTRELHANEARLVADTVSLAMAEMRKGIQRLYPS